MAGHLAVVGERLNRTSVEDLTLDRASLQDRALHVVELVETRREEILERRRDGDLAVVAAAIATISVTNRGFPPEVRTIFSRRSAVNGSGMSRSTSTARQRLERDGERPLRAALGELGAGEAEEQDGRAGESRVTCSTRSRNVGSPHWMSSNTQTSGACSSSSLRKAQAISSAEVRCSVSPSSARMEAASAGSEGTWRAA